MIVVVAVMMVSSGGDDAVPKSLVVENDRWSRFPWVNDSDDRLRSTMAAVQDLFTIAIVVFKLSGR